MDACLSARWASIRLYHDSFSIQKRQNMNSTTSQQTPNRNTRKLALYGVGTIIVVFVIMQFVWFFVPEFALDNPPVTNTVAWDSPETEALWKTACADCHSNETVYPWYSYVAPVGWLVAHDTHEGRDKLNISNGSRIELDEMIEVIEEGEMPLPIYTVMHPDAALTDSQRTALVEGLRATFGTTSTHTTPVTSTNNDDDGGDHDEDDD